MSNSTPGVAAGRFEGRLANQQLIQQHADAPPVRCEARATALDDLRRLLRSCREIPTIKSTEEKHRCLFEV